MNSLPLSSPRCAETKSMLRTFSRFLFLLIVMSSCSNKDDQSKKPPTLASSGVMVQVKYNPVTAQTEFTGTNLNWLGGVGTDYVVGISPGSSPVYDGFPINMTLPGYIPGEATAAVPGNASLARVFICPAGSTYYSPTNCSGAPYCP